MKVRIKELEDGCKHHLRREDVLQWKRVVKQILDERQMEVAYSPPNTHRLILT